MVEVVYPSHLYVIAEIKYRYKVNETKMNVLNSNGFLLFLSSRYLVWSRSSLDFSKHVKNGVITYYTYYEYEELSAKQREVQKRELQCYDCHARTKFTHSSKSGTQAYFSLMPGEEHEPNCRELKSVNDNATKRRKREENHYIEAVEKIQNTTGEIEIDSTSSALFEKLENNSAKKTNAKRHLSKDRPSRKKENPML